MRESELESKFNQAVKGIGGLSLKFVSPGFNGVPDRIILLKGGRVRFAELKRPGEKMRQLQLYRKKQFKTLGVEVTLIDSIDAIQKFIVENA